MHALKNNDHRIQALIETSVARKPFYTK